MGDAADDIIEGRTCQICGQWMDGHPEFDGGYPITCDGCKDE